MIDPPKICRNCIRYCAGENSAYRCKSYGFNGFSDTCDDFLPRFVYALVVGEIVMCTFEDRDEAMDELERCSPDGCIVAIPQEDE